MARLTIATLSLSIAAAAATTPAATTRTWAAPKPAAAPLPGEARAVMAQVRAAAGKRDWEALRGLMVEAFDYDPNEPHSAAAALESWKKDAGPVKEMVKVLRSPKDCKEAAAGTKVECTGVRYFVAFAKTAAGWRMTISGWSH